MKEQIVVSLTTWKKRITNVPVVLDTIWTQTIQPDCIILNVSEEEFVDRALPDEIIKYAAAHDKLRINWVGKDTKVWKKFIPTFELFPDALVIPIDDDMLYPGTMIEEFMKVHKQYPDAPISGNHYFRDDLKCHCGCASMVMAKHFGRITMDELPKEILDNCPSSDLFYTHAAARNGYFYKQTRTDYQKSCIPFNPVCGYSESINKGRLGISAHRIYNYYGYRVRKLFEDSSDKPLCVLGAAQTNLGIDIEKQMLQWLVPNYKVYVVEHDGRQFEYTAIKFLSIISELTREPILYVHTKGAYNARKVTHRVQNMWESEFVTKRYEYFNAANGDEPKVVTPYTGSGKVTWYNGWVANAAAIKGMDLILTEDRFYYEHRLFQNAEVIGIRMNNIDRSEESRAIMHKDLKDNFD